MATQKHEIRLAVNTLRSEAQGDEHVNRLLTQIEQIIPQGPRIVKEVIVAWMAHETLLRSSEYSNCVSLLMRVWNFTDIESLVAQEKANQQAERASDAKAMLPKVDPVAARIAALEAQLADLKSGKTTVKSASTPRIATPATGSTHELQRKMYSLGYTTKTKALKAGASEAEAERQAVEAKREFAQLNGLDYNPTTQVAAPIAVPVVAPIISDSLVEEAPVVEQVVIEAETTPEVEEEASAVEDEVVEDAPIEVSEDAEVVVEAGTTDAEELLQQLAPSVASSEVAALPAKKSRKASK